MKRLLSAAGFALAALAWHGSALATPVEGNQSTVTLLLEESCSLSIDPTGAAMVDSLGRFVLPITSGDVTFGPMAGSIDHEGSGIEFARHAASVTIDNLRIDFGTGIVSGDVSGSVASGNMDLFDLMPCANGNCTDGHGGIPVTEQGLFLRAAGATLFNGLFKSSSMAAGDQLGLAEVHLRLACGQPGPGPVPEPNALLLSSIGLAGFALARTRHRPVTLDARA